MNLEFNLFFLIKKVGNLLLIVGFIIFFIFFFDIFVILDNVIFKKLNGNVIGCLWKFFLEIILFVFINIIGLLVIVFNFNLIFCLIYFNVFLFVLCI